VYGLDGHFSWLESGEWSVEAGLDENSMMARELYTHKSNGISLSFRDFVDVSYDFFGRVIVVQNHSDKDKDIRLFFGQVFQISDAGRADTAIYSPSVYPYILTYHRNLSFVAGLRTEDGEAFDQYAVGNYGIEGKAGTYLDAEDGELSGNNVEHGGVDSIIRTSFHIKAKHAYHVDYWIAASDRTYNHATHIHRHLSRNGLYHYLNATTIHWKKWLDNSAPFLNKLDAKYLPLAKKSLLTIKAHCDERGGILASADSSIYNYGRDYYNYVWPRDAYYSLMPLLRAGHVKEVKTYLDFIMRVRHQKGYVHHKYMPDYSLGSTWHPLIQESTPELNIQEDETDSTVLLAIEFIEKIGIDNSFAKKLWKKLIYPAAEFMAEYIDKETGLPHASYDLWEQVFLTTTYSTAVTYNAIVRAALLAKHFDPDFDTTRWAEVARSIETNVGKLFDNKNQWFVRGLKTKEHGFDQVDTLDISSLYALSTYGPLKPDNMAVFATQKAVEEHLVNKGATGGVIRYPGDDYMLTSHRPGNPWYVCTSWLAQHLVRTGNTQAGTDALDWFIDHVGTSGMLSEQLDPDTGEVRGVSPLVWSHAEYLSLLYHVYGN
jgi:GH15 family glucan-1,4-alpha-glucosidase